MNLPFLERAVASDATRLQGFGVYSTIYMRGRAGKLPLLHEFWHLHQPGWLAARHVDTFAEGDKQRGMRE